MSRAKQTLKQKRRGKTLPALGAAGLSLALASSAHAATDGTAVDKPTLKTLVSQEIILAEEEISDVSLSTFYVFDKENPQKPQLGQQIAWGVPMRGLQMRGDAGLLEPADAAAGLVAAVVAEAAVVVAGVEAAVVAAGVEAAVSRRHRRCISIRRHRAGRH